MLLATLSHALLRLGFQHGLELQGELDAARRGYGRSLRSPIPPTPWAHYVPCLGLYDMLWVRLPSSDEGSWPDDSPTRTSRLDEHQRHARTTALAQLHDRPWKCQPQAAPDPMRPGSLRGSRICPLPLARGTLRGSPVGPLSLPRSHALARHTRSPATLPHSRLGGRHQASGARRYDRDVGGV